MFRNIFPLFLVLIITLYSFSGFSGEGEKNIFIQKSITSPTPNITGIAFDGKNIWVADWKEDVIYSLDPTTGKKVDSLTSPGPTPTGVAWDGSHLWVVDLHFNKAYRINVQKKSVVWEIPLPGSYPFGLAWDGKFLWLSDRNSRQIMKISPTDGAVFSDMDSPGGEITGITFFKGYLWASNRIDDEIYMIDPANKWVINIYKSPGEYPWGLASNGSNLLCADYNDGKVYFLKVEPGKDPWVRDEKKDYKLEFVVDFYNYGRGAIDGGEMIVALPQSRENQEIISGPVFEPEPDSIFTSTHEQKFAIWNIGKIIPPARKRATVKWDLSLFSTDWFVFPDKAGTEADIPERIKKLYLADGEKYLINDPIIKKIVQEVVGNEKNIYNKARKLYEYVIEKLEYKLAGGWETAPKVLTRGSGSCSEYTFSFISLCRAAGIPARFVGSVVVRKDDSSVDDVFHRWAEVYIPPYGWIPVDANHGDKPDARGRALGFGHLTPNLFVTTIEGKLEENKLGWGYNYDAHYTYQGEANTFLEGVGYWRPLKKGKNGASCGIKSGVQESVCDCGLPE